MTERELAQAELERAIGWRLASLAAAGPTQVESKSTSDVSSAVRTDSHPEDARDHQGS